MAYRCAIAALAGVLVGSIHAALLVRFFGDTDLAQLNFGAVFIRSIRTVYGQWFLGLVLVCVALVYITLRLLKIRHAGTVAAPFVVVEIYGRASRVAVPT